MSRKRRKWEIVLFSLFNTYPKYVEKIGKIILFHFLPPLKYAEDRLLTIPFLTSYVSLRYHLIFSHYSHLSWKICFTRKNETLLQTFTTSSGLFTVQIYQIIKNLNNNVKNTVKTESFLNKRD